MHEADEVAPVVAMLGRGETSPGALAGEARQRPDLAQQWLELNAVFVDGPQFNGRVGEGHSHRAQEQAQHPQPCAQAPQVAQPSWRPTRRPRRWLIQAAAATVRPLQRSPAGAAPTASAATNSSCCDAL